MPRKGHCGRFVRTPELIARLRASAKAHWADPEVRRRHGALTRARMSRPGVSERISARTREALAKRSSTDAPADAVVTAQRLGIIECRHG
jgi:hypothetical protein